MTTRTYTKTKKGHTEEWSWEETEEVRDAIAAYWTGIRATSQYWNKESGDVSDEG